MKADVAKTLIQAAKELDENNASAVATIKNVTTETTAAKNLWRSNNKSTLIKTGMTLIALPDPIVSNVLGAFLIATGVVQEGIRHRTLYVDDVYKTLQHTLREIQNSKTSV